MTDQVQQQQQQDFDLTFKASFINAIISALDEVPHKFSRPIIDALSRSANEQIQAMQQQSAQPQGPLSGKVVN